jgi:transposase-like protein
MARKVNLQLRQVWRDRLERQRRGGLSVSEFCRREGVSSATYYTWKKKFRGQSPGAMRRSSGRPENPGPIARPVSAGPAFVQLPAVAATPVVPWIELVLADGTIIRLPHQNVAALQAVLQALRGAVHARGMEGARHA